MADDKRHDDRTRSFKVLIAGTRVKNYEIKAKVGRGGMGEVFLAEDTSLGRKSALKFLLPHVCEDEECRTRFKREAQASAALDHPNIVTIYEVDEFDGRPFFAMQYIDGLAMGEHIKRKRLELNDLIDLNLQICEGLNCAHRDGVIHRDIKPSNIMIDRSGRPKIADFGLAHIQGSDSITESGAIIGTVAYMSPEQLQSKKVDNRSDLFSLGTIMYESITGKQPFEGDSRAAVINSILNDTPEPLARYKNNVPDSLERVVSKLLQKDPDLRYQSAADVASDLRRIKADLESGISRPVKSKRPLFKNPIFGFTISIFLIALIAIPVFSPSIRNRVLETLGIFTVPERKHLAVLPFVGAGEKSAKPEFIDGLLEIITSRLNQMEAFHGTLQVIPASEIRHNMTESAREAHHAFGATLAITGSFHKIDDSVRLIINLVDARKERLLRSSSIQNSADNISSLQDSAVLALAHMLEIQLRPEQRQFLSQGGTNSPEAYSYYLEGLGRMQEIGNPRNLDSAIQLLHHAVNLDDKFAMGYSALGRAYWNRYQLSKDSVWIESARANSNRAIELNDDLSRPHVILGNIYSEFRESDLAYREFETALKIDSTSDEAYKGLARAYESSNDHRRAEATYRKVIRMRPDYPEAYFNLAWFYLSRARIDDALLLAQKIADLNPEGYTVWNNLGALYYYAGKYTRARETWERSLKIEPNYGAYSNLGSFHFAHEHFGEAAKMYENALRLNDDDYRVWMNLAGVYSRIESPQGRDTSAYKRAIEMAEHQKLVNPDDPEVLSHLAEAYSVVGKNEQAIEHIKKALALAPNNVNYFVSAGLVFELAEKRDSAVVWIGKALQSGVPYERIENIPELDKLRNDERIRAYLTTDRTENK